MRTIVGITGASGAVYAVDFLRRCEGDKYLIASKWGKAVLNEELNVKVEELGQWVKKTFNDSDLASPFSSGSNHFDSMVIVPCSVSTLAKIANGIADTLITRTAQVALKEKRKLIIALRETPLSTVALENAARLSGYGAIIMPISPPHYSGAKTAGELVGGFADKLLSVVSGEHPNGWRSGDLE
ncbi:MAG: UbiX family flavin prenyltransferase [Candidatus Mycalebacterium zealandia]|nr:MAG: UbiX family flavin prenyltransferase [Candidatus Mycalebacterium zealandia]